MRVTWTIRVNGSSSTINRVDTSFGTISRSREHRGPFPVVYLCSRGRHHSKTPRFVRAAGRGGLCSWLSP